MINEWERQATGCSSLFFLRNFNSPTPSSKFKKSHSSKSYLYGSATFNIGAEANILPSEESRGVLSLSSPLDGLTSDSVINSLLQGLILSGGLCFHPSSQLLRTRQQFNFCIIIVSAGNTLRLQMCEYNHIMMAYSWNKFLFSLACFIHRCLASITDEGDYDVFTALVPVTKSLWRETGLPADVEENRADVSNSEFPDANVSKILMPLSIFLACLIGSNQGLFKDGCGIDMDSKLQCLACLVW